MRTSSHKNDVASLNSDVGAGPHGNAEIGGGNGRPIIDTIADECDPRASLLKLAHLGRLVLGQDLRKDLLDAELACDRLRGAGIISGDHDGSQATPVQSLKASGVSAKMIRYYESIGLVPKPGRTGGGYRAYSDADIHRLRFVRRARDLGFAVDQVRELLRLWSEQKRSHADVRSLALEHIRDLEHRATQLRAMIITLKQLVSACEDAHRPECPIIRELESVRTRLKAVGKATWRGVRS